MADKTINEKIEDLGTRIINCDEKCDGVYSKNDDRKNGRYPACPFLDPKGATKIDVLILGINPGPSSNLQMEFYKALAERNAENIATYKDWRRIMDALDKDIEYFKRPRHLLDELKIIKKDNTNGILWAEIFYCEKKNGIPKETFEKCSKKCSKYLNEILELVPKGKHILCLGDTAFERIKTYVKNGNKWKVIGIDHPTRRYSTFFKYFEEKEDKDEEKLQDRKIRSEFVEELKRDEKKNDYLINFLWDKVSNTLKVEKP